MHDLRRSMVNYDMAMLRALGETRGLALDTNVQTEAVDRLAQALLDPVSLRTAVARLSPPARAALAALLAAGGRLSAPRFFRQFGEIRPVGPGRLAREAPWQAPANPVEELWYAALIFRAFGEGESGPVEFVYVPADVRPLLPGAEAAGQSFVVDPVTPPPATPPDPIPLVQDLFHYLVLVQTRDVRPDPSGHPPPPHLAALRERVPWADERRLALVHHLAARLEMVVHDGKGGALRLETAAARRWLTAAPGEQIDTLRRAWRDDPTWKDLCQVPGLECDTEAAWHQRYDATGVRHRLLGWLARCPHQGWWSLASFVRAVKDTDPDFQRPDGDYTGWYVRDAASREYLAGFESWEQVEGALIADLCTGTLQALGLVKVAPGAAPETDGPEGGTACQLTPDGLLFLQATLAPETVTEPDLPLDKAPAAQPVVVRPDFSIEVPLPARLYTRFQVERFADPQGSTPRPAANSRGGLVYRYHLSAASLGRGLARGIRVEQVLAFLRQVTHDRVPAQVAGQIQAWSERHGQAMLQEVALLRVKSERAMRELMALPQTRGLVGRQLSPTTALVRREHLGQLRRELRELGYLPPEE